MRDLDHLGGRFLAGMRIIALDRDGCHAGFGNAEGTAYIAMTDEMAEPESFERKSVPIKQRWGQSSPEGSL
jgi:hypothetical protein